MIPIIILFIITCIPCIAIIDFSTKYNITLSPTKFGIYLIGITVTTVFAWLFLISLCTGQITTK